MEMIINYSDLFSAYVNQFTTFIFRWCIKIFSTIYTQLRIKG